MSTGLLVTALVNLFLGFVHSFILLPFFGASAAGSSPWALLLALSVFPVGLLTRSAVLSMVFGVPAIILGEAMTFIIVASVVSAFGWRYGFLGAGLVGLIGVLVIWRFFP